MENGGRGEGATLNQGKALKWHWPSKCTLMEASTGITRGIENLGFVEDKEEEQ